MEGCDRLLEIMKILPEKFETVYIFKTIEILTILFHKVEEENIEKAYIVNEILPGASS
jgi:hypothetical protein